MLTLVWRKSTSRFSGPPVSRPPFKAKRIATIQGSDATESVAQLRA